MGQFFDARLLDELIVQIGSVTQGCGKPLFQRRVLSPFLKLKSVQQFSEGMAELRYVVKTNRRSMFQCTRRGTRPDKEEI